MRGKQICGNTYKFGRRITPAHAGKTRTVEVQIVHEADHPRACGENTIEKAEFTAPSGSPPRMRGKLSILINKIKLIRITPAHAGKTGISEFRGQIWTDHPRACGENFGRGAEFADKYGSPPRMRGKP